MYTIIAVRQPLFPGSRTSKHTVTPLARIQGIKRLTMEDVTARSSGTGAYRILMVAPQPFFRPRGTPFSVLHRIRALLAQGHAIDLVTYPFGEDVAMEGLRILRAGRPPWIRDVRIGPSVQKLMLDLYLYAAVRRQLAKGTYDVLHSHEEAAFFCMRLARRHGLLHVYDMHSSLPQQLSNFRAYNVAPIRGMFAALERRVLQSCDGVITICPELAVVAERMCTNVPHSMIENTADNRMVFGESARDIRAELGFRDARIILYTGTFEPYQGLELLLDGFEIVSRRDPGARLLLVGGRPEQMEHYRERCRSRDVGEHISFVGAVHPSLVPSYLQAADVIVSPRTAGTNTPLKIYEYLRSGRPLVATDLPTHTQALDSDTACLVAPDPESLAAGILRVLQDEAYASALAQAATRKATNEYSDAAFVERVGRFYARLGETIEADSGSSTALSSGSRSVSSR